MPRISDNIKESNELNCVCDNEISRKVRKWKHEKEACIPLIFQIKSVIALNFTEIIITLKCNTSHIYGNIFNS